MSPCDKVRTVLHDLGVNRYDLLWQTSVAGKPHSFTVRIDTITLHGCTTRAIIRAIRRTLARKHA